MEPFLEQLGDILGYLRPSWTILGVSWDQELPRHLPDGSACAPGSPSCPILGLILGPKIGIFLVIFGVILWITYRSLFGTLLEFILGPFWDQIGPRRGQDEPKRAIKRFEESKSCIFKNLKKHWFFNVFGVQRLSKRASRGPRRLPGGTQRVPKPQQKGIQKVT